jgi:hypothetical protein
MQGVTMQKCKNCGVELDWHSRSHKETCSDKCRKAWSRRKSAVKTASIDAHWAVLRLRGLMKEYPELKPMVHDALRQVRQDVQETFYAYPDEETKQRLDMINDRARKRDAGLGHS